MPRSLVHIISAAFKTQLREPIFTIIRRGSERNNAIYTEMNVLVKMALGISRNLTQGNNG